MKFKFQRMRKPKKRDEIKEVFFYRGYWLLDYGNGYYSSARNGMYAPKERVIQEINRKTEIEDIEQDIRELVQKHEELCAREQLIKQELAERTKLLEEVKRKQAEETEN